MIEGAMIEGAEEVVDIVSGDDFLRRNGNETHRLQSILNGVVKSLEMTSCEGTETLVVDPLTKGERYNSIKSLEMTSCEGTETKKFSPTSTPDCSRSLEMTSCEGTETTMLAKRKVP
jgi:hypothetical protein